MCVGGYASADSAEEHGGITGFARGAPLSVSAHAELKTSVIEYKHGDAVLEGYLAYDEAIQGKRPGVIVVHEWWGLNNYAKMRTEQLAKLGYIAFAIDMYGKGVRAKDAKEAASLSGTYRSDRSLMRSRARAGLAGHVPVNGIYSTGGEK